jgi:hypothetical protein
MPSSDVEHGLVTDFEEQLTRYQFQMGPSRGRLAAALDLLTDALALVGQHSVYCRPAGGATRPASDLRLVMGQLDDSKRLIIDAMEELKKDTGQRD